MLPMVTYISNVTSGHNHKMTNPPISSPRPPESYRHGNLRNAALDEAAALVAARGGAEFSLREIAERLGVRHTALYRHFESRDALISTLAARAFERMRQRFEEAETTAMGDAGTLLDGLMAAYLAMVRDEPGSYRVMFSNLSCSDPARAEVSGACFAILVNAFSMAQRAGLARSDVSALDIASVNWAALHGLAMLRLDGQLGEDGCAGKGESLLPALRAILQDGWMIKPRP